MAQKDYLDFLGLQLYDEKIKAHIDSKDAATLQGAKDYADSLADNYDAAGTAQSKMEELANGAVKSNTEAIAVLNGNAQTAGSVDKKIADAKALIDADIDAVEASVAAVDGDVTALEGRMDAVEGDIGTVEDLTTTAKTDLVSAINEVKEAVTAGNNASAITIDTTSTTAGALKSYTIKQGSTTIGTIDIPKDMVVQSGEVVTNPEGQVAGTYIKLVLANVAEPLFINVGTLVDIYKAKADAAQVQVVVDSATREISATIVAGSIGVAELAANAVVTEKIADANVTKAKLSTAVQTSLDKADASASDADLQSAVGRVAALESKVGDGFVRITEDQINGLFSA